MKHNENVYQMQTDGKATIYIYIYIYMCVCVCVCVCIADKYIYIYIYVYIYMFVSYFQIQSRLLVAALIAWFLRFQHVT